MKLNLSVVVLSVVCAGVNLGWTAPDTNGGPVQRYGRLQVKGGQLCDQTGQPVQLRGMSSHDLKQFPFTSGTVQTLARDWRVSLVRAAMYVESYGSSYIKDPGVKTNLQLIVQEALRNNIYVIVDWHILEDGNPNRYRTQAREFFEEMAKAYASRPNVLYEICNEPNGDAVTWQAIKAYAEVIIPAIRAIAPDSVIIVGTDSWCQGVRAAADAPLAFKNVVYALHFYSGTHREALRKNADYALSKGAALFVSEWGLTDATGKGRLYTEEGERWLAWMNQHKLSWANWSLSTADEGSAALTPSALMSGPWPESKTTPSGLWVKARTRQE